MLSVLHDLLLLQHLQLIEQHIVDLLHPHVLHLQRARLNRVHLAATLQPHFELPWITAHRFCDADLAHLQKVLELILVLVGLRRRLAEQHHLRIEKDVALLGTQSQPQVLFALSGHLKRVLHQQLALLIDIGLCGDMVVIII